MVDCEIFSKLKANAKIDTQGENIMEPSKKDWKLYREKIVGWQETYMERLIKEYVDYLNSFSLCAKWDEITDAYNLDKAGLDKTCLTILINQRWMMR